MNAVKIYGGKEIKKLAGNVPETAPMVGDDDYKQPFLTKKEQASRQVHV